ncbi:hypothetical protein CVM73_00070 [Bradyrhizobium forestalis]|uniref:Uncharacterized protein n=1 Tax=Bradyrhizobium forestalis TaxID=1419263 RepID=A0A2M8RGB8_9BRAD|nr:hypothetical protein CVM73_00070 [Bradyrhizobium forestalis]
MRGFGVSSVASRGVAAGLPALSAMEILAREPMPSPSMDRSHRVRRLLPDHFGDLQWCCMAMAAGAAVPRYIEIRFGGAVASCYLWSSMGAEGGVTNTSRRPN